MSLTLKICTDKTKWDEFVASSAQSNIFCKTSFIDTLEVDYDLLLIKKDKRIFLGAIVLKKKNRLLPAPHSFFLYQGILFDKIGDKMAFHHKTRWMVETVGFLLAEMEKRYPLISFCLHPSIKDLRSFQWFHYHEPNKGHFKINLRYTGLINLKETPNFENYIKTIRKVRRYEYYQALKNNLKVELSKDIKQLDYLHYLTFERQDIQRSKNIIRDLKVIAKVSLLKGFGELLICRDVGGKAIGATLFLYDKKCAYYLVGVNHPDYRKSGSGTFLFLESIKRSFKKGVENVDVCGINSPHRGDFKTSFNAVPTPYFEVFWRKPSR